MADSIYLKREFVVVGCYKPDCTAGEYAFNREFFDTTKRTGQFWTCPNGHSQHWSGKTTEQKLEDAEARQRALQDQLEAAEAEAEATRVKLIRDRHRFANGVCPCCNRSFENVARHMKTQHPNFDPGDLRQPEKAYKCSCGRSFGTPHGLKIHQARNRSDDWADPKQSKYWRHLTVAR